MNAKPDPPFIGHTLTRVGLGHSNSAEHSISRKTFYVIRHRALVEGQAAARKGLDDYLFTNRAGNELAVGVVRIFPLGFERHNLRHFPASTWLRLGTPVDEVAEYLGDGPRTVLAVYAHVLGEDQRRAHADRLAQDVIVPKKIGPALRERAVRLVCDHRAEYPRTRRPSRSSPVGKASVRSHRAGGWSRLISTRATGTVSPVKNTPRSDG